jgi:hypothetical protein
VIQKVVYFVLKGGRGQGTFMKQPEKPGEETSMGCTAFFQGWASCSVIFGIIPDSFLTSKTAATAFIKAVPRSLPAGGVALFEFERDYAPGGTRACCRYNRPPYKGGRPVVSICKKYQPYIRAYIRSAHHKSGDNESHNKDGIFNAILYG